MQGPDDRGAEPGESPKARHDRELIELLNELRVALPGVQVLFAFLLAVPFSRGWPKVSGLQKDAFFVAFIGAAVSSALLIAPSSIHRLGFRVADKGQIVRVSTALTVTGSSSANTITTGSGNDIIDGGGGADIIAAVDEPIHPTRCDTGSPGGIEGVAEEAPVRCQTHDLWDELGRQIRLFLQAVTLADVAAGRIRGRAVPVGAEPKLAAD